MLNNYEDEDEDLSVRTTSCVSARAIVERIDDATTLLMDQLETCGDPPCKGDPR
jgi:hypothetical protein